jgi:hypothetical protein
LGFELYPHAYSIGAETVSSMSLALNASTEFYGKPRRGVSGDGVTQNLLRRFGYETHGIYRHEGLIQGIGSSYDITFPKTVSSTHKLVSKAILMGEFRFDVQFDRPSLDRFIEYKLSIFKSVPNKPRFVFVWINRPGHSQNSGACRPNDIEIFSERLIIANGEMKQDVEAIIQNDPGAIIIVAGDHGPYLTKNCTVTGRHYDVSEISRLDIQDRFGTFLAIKWPGEDFSKYDDITVFQDLFPTVFAYLFKDEKFLEAKVAPTTLQNNITSGASVRNGIINGGINDGEPLFVDQR